MSEHSDALVRLARLRGELALDLTALARLHGELVELLSRWPPSRPEVVVAAVNLHAWYTCLETLLERIARLLDESVPAGPAWHADLIAQMRIEVPGVRPAVLPGAVLPDLAELRKFRHFFRNAYVLDLDEVRIAALAQRVLAAQPPLLGSIGVLQALLDGAIAELAS